MPNYFSELKTGEVSGGRRLGHSFTQGVHGDLRRFAGEKAVHEVGSAVEAADFVGKAVGGTVVLTADALQWAKAAAAAVGVVAAMAGPQAGIVLGVVGLLSLVHGTLSDRESAHKKLAKYVWTMVDTDKPELDICSGTENLFKAAEAAATLLNDGKNQIALLPDKLKKAEDGFKNFVTKFRDLNKDFYNAVGHLCRTKGEGELENARALRSSINKMFDENSKPGGAAFEYVRRLCHTGNYLQAPYILALAMKEKFLTGSAKEQNFCSTDYFGGNRDVAGIRQGFDSLSEMYEKICQLPLAVPKPPTPLRVASVPPTSRPAIPGPPVLKRWKTG
jgi:DNA-binding ferritin-like protein (Dps family)